MAAQEVFGIACRRGATSCARCGVRRSEVLCDFRLTGAAAGRTCDARMCARCARRVDGKDYCPPHLVAVQGSSIGGTA